MIRRRIIIIGYGPAGMACAIQLKRMGLQPLVIEKDRPGGMLYNANLIENYPGFPGGIPGKDLAELITMQAERFGIETVKDQIRLVTCNDDEFDLEGLSGPYRCGILVVATGTVPVIPDDCPMDLVREGLIHFDIRSLRDINGSTIGIIGAGDAAFDYSLTLREKDNNVFIFNRGNKVNALKILQEKVFVNNDINYLENIQLKSLEMRAGKELTAIFNSASGNKKYVLDYLIFATGRKPADEILHESVKSSMPGLINKHKLYLIGDISNGPYRQVSVAVGDGVRTAMEISSYEGNQ